MKAQAGEDWAAFRRKHAYHLVHLLWVILIPVFTPFGLILLGGNPGEACLPSEPCAWNGVCVEATTSLGICERGCDDERDCPDHQRCMDNLDPRSNWRAARVCERLNH